MKVLIADDNREFCLTLADVVAAEGWQFETRHNPEEALEYLELHHREISVVLLDIEFNHPALNGMDVLERSMRNWPHIPVVMITGIGTIDAAVKATRLGAMNFIEKSSIDQARLREVLYTAMERVNTEAASAEMDEVMRKNGIIGRSREMLAIADDVMRYGGTELNVLITGETGTGKKLIAQALHDVSQRRARHFVTVDIPNIPANLFQSELFGHVKGAFSGATESKQGLFQQAHGGTIFLDEIGDMPAELQANLLLPVEDRSVRKLGSVKQEEIDVRFIAATDKDLIEAIRDGRFREQLYHRLRECEIHLPALRERTEDIPQLVDYFVKRHNEKRDDNKVMSPGAYEYMQTLTWPGNIRELENTMKVILQTSRNDTIEVADVSRNIRMTNTEHDGGRGSVFVDSGNTLKEDVERLNKLKIEDVLSSCNGNVSKASNILGISRETLHTRIRKYEIDVEKYRRRRK